MERAMALCQNDRIEAHSLPDEVAGYRAPHAVDDIQIPEGGINLSDTLESIRAAYIQRALEMEGGVMVRAAGKLGMTFRSIRYFVKKYGLSARES